MAVAQPVAQSVANSVAQNISGPPEGGGGGGGGLTVGALRLAGNAQFATIAQAIGGIEATNFEIQMLALFMGVPNASARCFMIQYPAGRQAGVFIDNTYPTIGLVTGDSNNGSVGGEISSGPTVPPSGVWFFLTFSAGPLVSPDPNAKWQGSIQSLNDASIPYFQGPGNVKGIENSLTATSFGLGSGGIDTGFANGLLCAEIRAYPFQRTAGQRQADIFRKVPVGTELFWNRVSGLGAPVFTDLSGQGRVFTNTAGVGVAGPTIP